MDTHKTQLQSYFDGVGYERWAAIYGQGALESRVRRTIRQGHNEMLALALAWLDEALTSRGQGSEEQNIIQNATLGPQSSLPVVGRQSSVVARGSAHVLDAGCGTGLLTVELARRGHHVTAVDLAPQMSAATAEAARQAGLTERVHTFSADLEQVEGRYDAAACLDVLVHYPRAGFAQIVGRLATLARGPLVLTYAPHNPLLAALHWIGGRFPHHNRRTEIQMTPDAFVQQTLAAHGRTIRRRARISRGFYHVTLIEVGATN